MTNFSPQNIDDYGRFTEEMWLGPVANSTDSHKQLAIMTLGLAGEGGEVVEHVKKFLRDGNLDKDALKKELGDAVYYWARICKYFDFLPSDVLATNVEKLLSRRARGTQRGQGDNR